MVTSRPRPVDLEAPRRRTLVLLVCAAALLVLVLGSYEPRLHHAFPSLVDDWYAIDRTPAQIGEALTLRSPEHGRYRPGWVVWNHLQWHTFGGPDGFDAARVWGLLRAIVLPLGLLAALVVSTWGTPGGRVHGHWRIVLAASIAGAVVTVPGFARDVARYGPQEPLLVGLACLGAALVAVAGRRALDGRAAAAVLPAVAGVLTWAAGVAQKESATCLLVLVPFLALELRSQRARLASLGRPARVVLAGLALGTLGPLVPMLVRTALLSDDDDLVYGASPGSDVAEQTVTTVRLASAAVGSPLLGLLVGIAAVVLVARVVTRRPDWLGIGFLATATAFLVFAAQTGVVVSRYYLPIAALAGLALCRTVAPLSRPIVVTTAATLAALAVLQLPSARREVQDWTGGERDQEALVRWTAGARDAGCTVDVTGGDVELVEALPVLVRYGGRRVDCDPSGRYVVVLSGTAPEVTDDPVLVACAPTSPPVLSNHVGRVERCASA